ncbi:MAG: NfeD family protein [Planctomycetota bacterium]
MTDVVLILAQGATSPNAAAAAQTQWLIWGIVLLAIAVALFFVEVFLPTGGIVGAASGLSAVAGVVCLFWHDSTGGLLAATGVILAMPFAIAFALKVAPDTPFARWVTLKDAQQAITQKPSSRTLGKPEVSQASDRGIKVGATGETLTPLFPVGTCLIDGKREECLARRGTIDKGTAIRVVAVDGAEVYVAPVESG